MENTLTNKKRFLAQYWGQYGFEKYHVGREEGRLVPINETSINRIEYVKLKSLKKLSKKDSIELLEILIPKYKGHFKDIKIKKSAEKIEISIYDDFGLFVEINGNGIFYKNWSGVNYSCRSIDGIDFLRRKGYAITWNGVEVPKLKDEYNWLKF